MVHCVGLRPTIEQSGSSNDCVDEFSCAKDFGKSNHQNHDKSNSAACVVGMEAKMQDERSAHWHFRKYKCCQKRELGVQLRNGQNIHNDLTETTPKKVVSGVIVLINLSVLLCVRQLCYC